MYPQDPNQPPQTPQPWQQPTPPPQAGPAPQVQPTPNQDYSIDYLNQISGPSKPPRASSSKFLMGLIIGLLALLVLVGGYILLSNRSTPMDKAATMLMRMETLQDVSKAQHKYLRDGQLRSTNSSFSLFLTNAIRDLEEPLKGTDASVAKLPKNQRDAEAAAKDELTASFDEARLNVTLDRAYAREMNYQLEVLHSMMVSIYSSTDSSALKEYLESTEANLAQISEDFDNFSGTK